MAEGRDHSNKTLAESVSDFTAHLTYRSLPSDVVQHVKFHIMNVLGLCLASSRLEAGKVTVEVVKKLGGKKEATIVASRRRTSAANAALANGAMSHVLDYDDTHSESFVHVGPPVIPAALAMGEREKVDGRSLITATAAGMEIAIRVGMVAPGQFSKIGFHPTSVCGIFGGFLAASKILHLNRSQIVNGLGVCGSQASGVLEFFSDGSWVKQFHPGWAAHSAIIAALMAEEAMTGPRTIFEGRFGLYKTHLQGIDYDMKPLSEGLGEKWEIPNIAYKPYPCGVVLHPFLYCASKLKKEHNLTADDVVEVECVVPKGMVPLVCEPADAKIAPRTRYDGKFSLFFTVAAMLADGKVDPSTFTEAKIKNPKILELAKRVKYTVNPEADYPREIPGKILVKTKNGATHEFKIDTTPGGPEYPMTKEEHILKFKSLASTTLNKKATEAIIQTIDRLEEVKNVRNLMELCK